MLNLVYWSIHITQNCPQRKPKMTKFPKNIKYLKIKKHEDLTAVMLLNNVKRSKRNPQEKR